jgi:hypothetical protein
MGALAFLGMVADDIEDHLRHENQNQLAKSGSTPC